MTSGHFSTEPTKARKNLDVFAKLTRHGVDTTDNSKNSGGADRDRTDDLRLAKPALSQLSYSPV